MSAAAPLALLGNYFQNTQKSAYSGATVTEISLYATGGGILQIGTAAIADVLAARQNGTALSVTPYTTRNVQAGLNTFALELTVGAEDVLVLGGGNSTAELYAAAGVEGADDYGFYAPCNEQASGALFAETDGIAEKLLVKLTVSERAEMPVFADLKEQAEGQGREGYAPSVAPFAYQNKELFEGKKLTGMELYVNSVQAVNDEQYITIYKIQTADLELGHVWNEGDALATYRVTLPVSSLQNTQVNDWVYVDLTDYGITVGEGETLAFGSRAGDPVTWAYAPNWSAIGAYQFYQMKADSGTTVDDSNALLFNFYYEATSSFEDRRAECELAELLHGKQLSILGDSISTFQGVSNDAEKGLANNAVYYTNQLTQADTYWQQLIDRYGMQLCVNNAWSGAYVTQHQPNVGAENDADGSVSSGMARADDLDANGVDPDYIVVFIGINDLNGRVLSTAVAEAYRTMLQTITTEYPEAHVFCLNMPNRNGDLYNVIAYNTAIADAVAQFENVSLVDVYHSEFCGSTYSENSIGDNLHPNAIGMDYMTEIIAQAMKDALLGA